MQAAMEGSVSVAANVINNRGSAESYGGNPQAPDQKPYSGLWQRYQYLLAACSARAFQSGSTNRRPAGQGSRLRLASPTSSVKQDIIISATLSLPNHVRPQVRGADALVMRQTSAAVASAVAV